jgi:osmotically-inducible protein OsmY
MTLMLAAPSDTETALSERVDEPSDAQLAEECLLSLRGHVTVPRDVMVTVSSGRATLDGTVYWDFQKQAAESAVKYIRGVRGVSNRIVVESPDDVEQAG